MAEGKKTFLMRVDEIHTFGKLTDEQAGVLIKHIFAYVNDLDPEPPDFVTELAFEPIKQRLKNELVTWKNRCEKNRENVRKRWGTKDTSGTNGIQPYTNYTDKDKDKDKDKEVYKNTQPTLEDFLSYSKGIEIYKPEYEFEIRSKYEAWDANGWKDGNDKPIRNWKTKLKNTMPYFNGVQQTKKVTW